MIELHPIESAEESIPAGAGLEWSVRIFFPLMVGKGGEY
jgi:hypothetical protein